MIQIQICSAICWQLVRADLMAWYSQLLDSLSAMYQFQTSKCWYVTHHNTLLYTLLQHIHSIGFSQWETFDTREDSPRAPSNISVNACLNKASWTSPNKHIILHIHRLSSISHNPPNTTPSPAHTSQRTLNLILSTCNCCRFINITLWDKSETHWVHLDLLKIFDKNTKKTLRKMTCTA